jgi:hypothetical protein
LFGLGYIFMIVSVITDGIKTPARWVRRAFYFCRAA